MNLAATRRHSSSTESSWRTWRETGVFVLGGVAVAGSDGRVRNQAAVFSAKGELLARYSKIHPFTLGGESQHYAAGTEIVDFDWQGCRVAPFVCYDLRFPELFRAAVKRGTQLFVVIANWPARRVDHWLTLQQAGDRKSGLSVGSIAVAKNPTAATPSRVVVILRVIRLDLGSASVWTARNGTHCT